MTISTILTILKVIGIVLLWILGIVLALVLLILFWPYRYKVNVAKNDSFSAKINLNYFFHFISAWVIYDKSLYEGGLNIRLKVLGIPIYDHLKHKAKKTSEQSDDLNDLDEFDSFEELDNTDSKADSKIDKSETLDNKINNKDIASDNDLSRNSESLLVEESDELNKNEVESDISIDLKDNDVSKKSLFDKLSDFIENTKDKIENKIIVILEKINTFFEKLEKASDDVADKIDDLINTYDYYEKLFSKKGTEWVIQYLKKKILCILKSIRPRYGKVYIKYGSDDPGKVGKMFEYYALALPFLPKKSKFIASYEEDVLNFDVLIKGRVILGYIAIIALQVFLNRKLRKFIKLLKREGKK